MPELIILFLSFLLRVYKLNIFPLNHDEANWMIPCADYFDKFFGIPIACFGGYIRPFIGWLVFFSRKIFSSPEIAVRIPTAIIGTLTVLLLYKLAKEMYGKEVGIISSTLLCFLPWHVIQSRDGREMITVPFFGCLIFLSLFMFLKHRKNFWLVLCFIFTGISSFYAYPPAILYVPIFLLTLFFIRKDLSFLKSKILFFGIATFFLIILPVIILEVKSPTPQYLQKFYWYFYKDGPIMFNESIDKYFMRIIENIKINYFLAFKTLFLSSDGMLLYGAAFKSPLLITNMSAFIILSSLVVSFWKRENTDKILLVWISFGYLGSISGVRFFSPRHIIIILIPLLILMGRFIAEILNYAKKKNSASRKILISAGILFFIGLVGIEIFQLVHYYRVAPTDFEECRRNSYGCKEAALYLSRIADLGNYEILTDVRMTVDTYLNYPELTKKRFNKKGKYYIIWAPESHPEDYWNGLFSQLNARFRKQYPDEKPVKTIYYFNGLPAIHIFKLTNDIP